MLVHVTRIPSLQSHHIHGKLHSQNTRQDAMPRLKQGSQERCYHLFFVHFNIFSLIFIVVVLGFAREIFVGIAVVIVVVILIIIVTLDACPDRLWLPLKIRVSMARATRQISRRHSQCQKSLRQWSCFIASSFVGPLQARNSSEDIFCLILRTSVAVLRSRNGGIRISIAALE